MKLFSKTRAARKLGVSLEVLNQAIKDQGLPVVRLGRRVRVEETALRRFVANGGQPGRPAQAASRDGVHA
jgi:excisionase family DNA binding protein